MQWKPSRRSLTKKTIIYHFTYDCTEVHSHSTVHWTGTFYCLIPAVCSLHHRCRSLQSCRLYWIGCVDHLWEYQGHHSQWLRWIKNKSSWNNGWNATNLLHTYLPNKHETDTNVLHTAFPSTPHHKCKCQELCSSLHFDRNWYRRLHRNEN